MDYNVNFYTVDDEGSEKLCMQVNKLYDEDIEVIEPNVGKIGYRVAGWSDYQVIPEAA